MKKQIMANKYYNIDKKVSDDVCSMKLMTISQTVVKRLSSQRGIYIILGKFRLCKLWFGYISLKIEKKIGILNTCIGRSNEGRAFSRVLSESI